MADMGQGAGNELLPLTVSGLVYHAGGRERLAGVDLEIASNGISVIMGPNGAGKSLLVRLLHGLLTPHGGTISWNGARPDMRVRLRQAMVFQKPVLLRRSVKANIEFILNMHKKPLKPVEHYLEEAGLRVQADQPARSLSGGEQQRLALVRALAAEPEVLFLDEPTASLDPASILRIETIISKAATDGLKIILVTHDISQAKRLAQDVAFLHGGRILEHCEAFDFFDRPKSREAAAYLQGRLLTEEKGEAFI